MANCGQQVADDALAVDLAQPLQTHLHRNSPIISEEDHAWSSTTISMPIYISCDCAAAIHQWTDVGIQLSVGLLTLAVLVEPHLDNTTC
eukprot:364743-Chlamydomonas_euryale.AAC.99